MKHLKIRLLALTFAALMLVSLMPVGMLPVRDGSNPFDGGNDDIADAIVQMDDFNLTNAYDKIWEPNNIRGSTHAIAVSDDKEWMATAGGYLNDREVHIYRWASNIYQYWPVCDAGDGIIMGDVMDVDFMDSDNNGRLEIVAGSTDGRVYVFEQLGLSTDPFNFSSPAHQWELVWDSGLYIDAQIWSVMAYDIDHDTHDEIIVGAWDNKVYLFDYIDSSAYPYCPNEHWIDFDPVWDSGDTITGLVNSVAVVDSDYDTRLEIVAGSEDNKVYLFEQIPCQKNCYVLRWTSGDAIWKPVLSVTASQNLDDDPYGEIVASAYGQGVYVFQYNPVTEDFDVNKISQGIKSWERGISYPPLSVYTGYEADEYIDRKIFGWEGYGVFEYDTPPPPYDTVALGGASCLGGPYDMEETTLDSYEQFHDQGLWTFDFGSEFGQFQVMYDIAEAPDGTFYITDFWNHRITQVTSYMEPIMSFGAFGSGPGQLDNPSGVTVDENGSIYVAEISNSRVSKFTSEGVFNGSWGEHGTGDGEFFGAYDVAIWEDRVYVSDFMNHRIHVRNITDGEVLFYIGGPGVTPGLFDQPAGLAFDDKGMLYVVDQLNNRIQKFDADGNYVLQFGLPGVIPGSFDIPAFVVVDDDNRVYVSDMNNSRVQKFSPSGEFESLFGSLGSDPGQFDAPAGMAFHPEGGILVLDPTYNRIQRFGVQEYELLEVFNAHTDQSGAYDIAFDSEGNFYVTDHLTPNVFKFSSTGQWLLNWTLPGTGFRAAWGVEIDEDDNVFVYDAGNSRIHRYDTEGNLVLSFGSIGPDPGQLRGMRDMAVGHYQIYVTEYVNNRVSVFDYDGNHRYSFGSTGTGLGEFSGPFGIEIGPDDLLYVSEDINQRVQRFRINGDVVDEWATTASDMYMAFDDQGFLYMSGLGFDSIKKYSQDGVLLDVLDYAVGNPELEYQGLIDSYGIIWRSENQSLFVCDGTTGKIFMMRPYIDLRNLATAVVDFGQWEEIGGDATDNYDLRMIFDEDIDIENVELYISADLDTWQPLNLSDQYMSYAYSLHITLGWVGILWMDVDHALREAHWDEFRYLKIGVKGGEIYHVDGADGRVARPINTALVVSTGFIRIGDSSDTQEKIIIGTIDGEIMAYTGDGEMVWESQADQPKFSLGTSIWDIVQVNGKALVPTWFLDGYLIDDAIMTTYIPGFVDFLSYTLINIDGTTALDLVATTAEGINSRLVYFRNTGTDDFPIFTYVANYFPDHSTLSTDLLSTYSTVTVGDLDGDLTGDLDLIITEAEEQIDSTWTYDIRYFEQTAALTWTEQSGYLSDLEPTVFFGDFLSRLSLIDMDFDGDLDITLSQNKLYFFEHKSYISGSGFWFELDESVYADINFDKKNETVFGKVTYWDFDLDGDIDVIVPHSSENITGKGYNCNLGRFTYWRNTGDRFNIEWTKTRSMFEPDFTGTLLDPEHGYDYPEFRDMNGDGILDLVCMRDDSIDLFLGDMDHDSFLCATYPYIHMVEVDKRLQDDGYWGYEAYDSWTNYRIFEFWSMSLEYGDVDQDEKPEVFVGSFDNNLIVFEQVTKNTYRRSFRSQDFFLNEVAGAATPFQINIFDMVIGDQDQDGKQEIILASGLNIYVFEVVGNDMYDLVWVSDPLAFWVEGQSADEDPTPKIPFVVTVDDDLDSDNRSEIIVGAQDFLVIFENVGDNNYNMVANYEFEVLELGNPFIRDIKTGDVNEDRVQDIVIVGTEDMISGGDFFSMGWVRYYTNVVGELGPDDNNYTELYRDQDLESAYCVDIANQDADVWLDIFIGAADGVNIYEFDDGGTPKFEKLLPTTEPVYAVVAGNTDGDSWYEVVAGVGKNITVFEQNYTEEDRGLHMYDPVWTSGELHERISDIKLGDSNVNGRTEIIATALKGYLYAYEWIANSSAVPIGPFFYTASTGSDTAMESEPSHNDIMVFVNDIHSELERFLQDRMRRFSIC